jgi:adenylate cyclase
MKKIELNPFIITLIIIGLGVSAFWLQIPFLQLMELKTIDLRFKTRGKITPSPHIVLAAVDEKSITKEGKWVWPRSKMAELVNRLSDAGAKVIGFDIGFLEPDGKQTVSAIENIKKETHAYGIQSDPFIHYLDKIKSESDNDQLLADAIKKSKAEVVTGFFFHMDPETTAHINQEELKQHIQNIKGARYNHIHYISGETEETELIDSAVAPQSNIPSISNSTDFSGFFNMFPDPDGVVRWLSSVIKLEDHRYAPLALQTLSAYLGEPLALNVAEYGIKSVQVGKTVIPTDERGRVLINYRGEKQTFTHVPVTDILRGKVPGQTFRDKIVLVGVTAVGIYDLRVTPFDPVFPGLEIHANLIDSILSDNYLFQPAWAGIFDILAIVIAAFSLQLILSRVGVIGGALAALSMLVIYTFACYFLFIHQGWVLNLVYPLSVIFLVYVSITAFKFLGETKQKKYIKDAFSTYLAPSVVKQIIDSPGNLGLGGQKRDITAFFSDVQGFTSISEKLTPEELVELLNEFLTDMTDIILKYEGTVDKFEGDAIIAFFGAPVEVPNHAQMACQACIEMQKKLIQLRKKWRQESRPILRMRIGLCSGQAIVGNMGSRKRLDYTMMGDTVNTAARLEGVNKEYNIYALISESTHEAVKNNIITREIDSVYVIGKKEPVRIYELMGYPEDVDEPTQKIIELYAQGLGAYRHRNWDLAIEKFIAALDIKLNDGPSKTMLQRCNQYKISPPEPNWNGAFKIMSK